VPARCWGSPPLTLACCWRRPVRASSHARADRPAVLLPFYIAASMVATNGEAGRTTNPTPNAAAEDMWRAVESMGLQLLRRRVHLSGAIELLRLLQPHPVVLAIDERLRRAMR
jgi:hypothetical protein